MTNNISVIIVNWNSGNYLLSCVHTLFQQKGFISQKVIIIDNGSQNGSIQELKKEFPFVYLIENKMNFGFAKAVNQGLKIANNKYILILNPDAKIEYNSINKLTSFMETYRDAGIAGAQLLNEDGSKQNSIANFPSLATELLNKSLLRWLFPKKYPGKEKEYSEPIEVDSIIGACMMVRREAIEQAGFLDEDYFLFFEETDWCYRMKKAGWKVYHVPGAEVIHFQGKSVEKEKERAKVEYYRSRYIFFKKNRGTLQWTILILGLLVKLIFSFLAWGIFSIATFFKSQKVKRKFKIYSYLLWWHLKGCPEGMGLKG